MANVNFLFTGSPVPVSNSPSSMATFILDATTDTIEYIFDVEENATITRLGFRYGARAGTPPTYRISLQGVNASGRADGVILGGGTPASATFTPPASTAWDGTWQWVNLTNSIAVVRGQKCAMVIDYSAGTIAAANSGTFTTYWAGQLLTFPTVVDNNAGTPTIRSSQPVFGYGSATKAYGFPVKDQAGDSFTTTEEGISFVLSSSAGNTFTVPKMNLLLRNDVVGNVYRFRIYGSDGTTVLAANDLDGDSIAAATWQPCGVTLDTLATLSFGTTYYAAVSRLSGAQGWRLYRANVNAVAEWDAVPGGQNFASVSRAAAGTGAWTTTTTQRRLWDLWVGDITPPSGGGGSKRVINSGPIAA